MKLEEFAKIVDGFTRVGTLIVPGVGPTLPAVAALSALRDHLPPEIRGGIGIGISITGQWYVTIHKNLIQGISASPPSSDPNLGLCVCDHPKGEHANGGKCSGILLSKDGVGVCPCENYSLKT